MSNTKRSCLTLSLKKKNCLMVNCSAYDNIPFYLSVSLDAYM